jgi:hypothetical protein
MKKTLLLIGFITMFSCGEGNGNHDPDMIAAACEDETCAKVIELEKRTQPTGSGQQFLWYWKMEEVCSGESFWSKSMSSTTPLIGAIICRDNWIKE